MCTWSTIISNAFHYDLSNLINEKIDKLIQQQASRVIHVKNPITIDNIAMRKKISEKKFMR